MHRVLNYNIHTPTAILATSKKLYNFQIIDVELDVEMAFIVSALKVYIK